ncbi:tRNA pseudouridine(13) synthase TruD [Halalkaliarchaeum sp. AArc-GB]|uniref:tRNA pseudouridine(13) synthase TruD n=1 Tax=Halalkaliarchaeum sp. AArc-GB TaxID=3074078 RepID=UPI0028608D9B|nr:tRNA pseudouridine(13) synthase TruD [Halalkaliarchaeum sp. AArc-GB]MDR5673503.1 tRNA pseudouridine(13) synthase TruD [Halalkaliarchaeum sp. AArc-GB]
MRPAHPREQVVGIDYYVSDAEPIGGRLRDRPADFRVREIEAFDVEPADADPGAYPDVVCRVTLRAWDTNDFAARLSDVLGMSRERISWAGTKDKHAVTTQLFSVRGVAPERIAAIDGDGDSDGSGIDGAEIDVVGRAGRPISFGDLAGNAFEIVVRDPDRPELADDVTAQLRSFATGGDEESSDGPGPEIGVPNVFGHQRFGSRRPITHEVGLAIVRGDWRRAVRTYVASPFEAEPDDTRRARAFVDDQFESASPDWQACLDAVPRKLGFERAMLHGLVDAEASDPGSTAPDAPVPDDGGVWRAALEAVPSNLQRLFVHAAQSFLFNRILSRRLDAGLPFHRPVAGDVCCFADADAPPEIQKPDPDRLQRADDSRVQILSRHCERGRAFVTAPLVGTETELADGEPGEIEREVLSDAGVQPADFTLPGEFDSTGTRRAILLRTDVTVEADPLTLSFALQSGSYATAVLREYLKVDPLSL